MYTIQTLSYLCEVISKLVHKKDAGTMTKFFVLATVTLTLDLIFWIANLFQILLAKHLCEVISKSFINKGSRAMTKFF